MHRLLQALLYQACLVVDPDTRLPKPCCSKSFLIFAQPLAEKGSGPSVPSVLVCVPVA